MNVKDRGTVFRGQQGSNWQSCVFPQICVLPSGRWLSAFRVAPTKAATADQRPALTHSDNQGRSWSPPTAPFQAPSLDGRPGLFRGAALTSLGRGRVLATLYWLDLSDPNLPFFNEQTQGLLDSEIFFALSEDQGQTWSAPWRMDKSAYTADPSPITGPVLLLPDGRWACQFEMNKHYYAPEVWRHRSVLMFSSDQGKTWPDFVEVTGDHENRVFYWDQRPNVLADGRILDLFWTYDNQEGVYLNIHARESLDQGRTWSPLWDTHVPGQPASPVSLPDGSIAMIYVDRTASPVLKLRTSRDGGHTWPTQTELPLYEMKTKTQTWQKTAMEDAWNEMGAFSMGLPAAAALPNGDILAVYYAGPQTDYTGVEWIRLTMD